MFGVFTRCCACRVLGVKKVMDKQEAVQVASGSPGPEDSAAGTNTAYSNNPDATRVVQSLLFFFLSSRFKVRAEDAD